MYAQMQHQRKMMVQQQQKQHVRTLSLTCLRALWVNQNSETEDVIGLFFLVYFIGIRVTNLLHHCSIFKIVLQ